MRSELRPAIVVLIALSLITGVAYPLLVTLVGSALFPRGVSGSLEHRDGRIVGSALIGQPFSDPGHFWGRPSATAQFPCNPLASGGSNRGPLDPALLDDVRARIVSLRAANPGAAARIPGDLVTTSASGLDPHISPGAALLQVERVARARDMPVADIRSMVERHTERPTFGMLGEPRVNVLLLNLALDEAPATRGGAR